MVSVLKSLSTGLGSSLARIVGQELDSLVLDINLILSTWRFPYVSVPVKICTSHCKLEGIGGKRLPSEQI